MKKWVHKSNWCSLLILTIISANHFMQRPLRDSIASWCGPENLNWLMLGSLVGTASLTCVILFLERLLQMRKVVPYLLLVSSAIQILLYQRLQQPTFTNALLYFSFNGATSITLLALVWRQLIGSLTSSEGFMLNAYTATNVGAIAGPLITLVFSNQLNEYLLLPASSVMLLMAALYLTFFDSYTSPHQNETANSFRFPIKRLISFMLLYTFVATGFYYFMIKTVSTNLDEPERINLFTWLDLTTNCVVLLLPPLLRRWSKQATAFLILPIISIILLSTLGIKFTLITASLALVVFKISNLTIQRPARELMYLQASLSTPYGTQSLIDSTIYRLGDMTAAWVITSMISSGAGIGHLLILFFIASVLWIVNGYAISKSVKPGLSIRTLDDKE